MASGTVCVTAPASIGLADETVSVAAGPPGAMAWAGAAEAVLANGTVCLAEADAAASATVCAAAAPRALAAAGADATQGVGPGGSDRPARAARSRRRRVKHMARVLGLQGHGSSDGRVRRHAGRPAGRKAREGGVSAVPAAT
jgi:hypothetical protein